MSRVHARTQSGINDMRWDVGVRFYRDLPPVKDKTRERHSVVAQDCWLYIFDPLGPLLYEVYADAQGIYHEVDVAKHAGKDIRPYALEGDGVVPTLPLVPGQRTTKGVVVIHHWLLTSPFQLPWSRFPHIAPDQVKDGKPHGGFLNWAQSTRDLIHFEPAYDEKHETFAQEVSVECPWLRAQALSDCFQIAQERWVSGFLKDTARIERKTLRTYVRSIEAFVGKERFQRDMLNIIDQLAFETEERHDKEQEDFPPEELVGARTALVSYLKSPRYLAVRDDAMASADPRARAIFAEIQANAEAGLEGVGGDPSYRQSVFQDNPRLFKQEAEQVSSEVKAFLDGHPEAMYGQPATLGWKEARKALKSYWYLFKAYLAQIDWIAPRRLTKDLKWFGHEIFGVLVDFDSAEGGAAKRVPDGTIKWPRLVVSPVSRARLAEKYSNNLEWNTFFVVLDAYNVIMACREQAQGKTDMKPVVAALGSFLNTAAAAIEATLQQHGVKHLIVTDKMIAELAEEAGKKSARGGSAGFAATLKKFNQPRTIGAVGKIFGLVGAAAEAWGASNKAKSARGKHDDDAAIAYDLSVGANATVTVGYVLGAVGTMATIVFEATAAWPLALAAIGSWLVLGGTATDLGAKLAVRRLEKDPLENWMKQTPWARESKYRIANFDELVTAFQRALVGLNADIRCGLTGFDVTVESRIVQSPAQIYLGLEWVSDAGAMQSTMAPMTQAECLGQNRFRHQEFASPVKQAIARIRLLLNGEWYPDEPTVFKFPS